MQTLSLIAAALVQAAESAGGLAALLRDYGGYGLSAILMVVVAWGAVKYLALQKTHTEDIKTMQTTHADEIKNLQQLRIDDRDRQLLEQRQDLEAITNQLTRLNDQLS